MTAIASRMTVDDFERLPDNGGLELVVGEIREKCMGMESLKLAFILATLMDTFVVAGSLGVVAPNDVGIDLRKLGAEILRKPDGMFIRRGRLRGNRPVAGWLTIAPDIAWAVVSPGDEVEALERKLLDYRRAGIPLVWVIYPGTRTARIQRADGSVTFIDRDGHLDGEDVLPGFRLRLGDLFDRYEAEIAALEAARADSPPPA